jgi:hypothetical protein
MERDRLLSNCAPAAVEHGRAPGEADSESRHDLKAYGVILE